MINYFRKIRHNLIQKNKTSKYLKYAIGEIILVVIGILIALQINTWNQNRLERLNEQKIIKDLKVEFEANYKDLNKTLKQHQIGIEELREFQIITKSKDYHNPKLNSLMNSLLKWFSFTDRPGASNNLISAGNLNIIQNKDLRDLITQWSGNVNDVADDELFLANFTRETVLPFITKNYTISNLESENNKMLESLGLKLDTIALPIFETKPINWEILVENQEFQSIVSLKKMYEYHCVLECKITLGACNNIITLINSELND